MSIHNTIYLVFNIVIALSLLPYAKKYHVLTKRFLLAVLFCFISISIPYIVWDAWAVANGHWFFSDRYTLNPRIAGMPIEEILFFFCIPFTMLLVHSAVKKSSKLLSLDKIRLAENVMIAFLSVGLVSYWERGYTRSALLAGIFTIILMRVLGFTQKSYFWRFQLIHLGLFFSCNLFLTALPIISYGDTSIIGLRVATIPLEDFLFSFSLISIFVMTHEFVSGKLKRYE